MATSGANQIDWWSEWCAVSEARGGRGRELPRTAGLQTTHQTNHRGYSLTHNFPRDLQPQVGHCNGVRECVCVSVQAQTVTVSVLGKEARAGSTHAFHQSRPTDSHTLSQAIHYSQVVCLFANTDELWTNQNTISLPPTHGMSRTICETTQILFIPARLATRNRTDGPQDNR